jgi:divalent metal cation (Fe/Co/Zn/Cd) transporter
VPLLEPSRRETILRIRRRVLAVDGVRGCEVHVQSSGKKPHIILRVVLEGNPGYEKTHRVSSMVDHEVRKVVPNARVTIGSESETGGAVEDSGLWDLVKRVAEHEPGSRGAHNLHVENLGGGLGVDFHLEVSARMTVKQAHDVAMRIEEKLKASNPRISEVVIHEETTSDRVSSERYGHGSELRWYLDHVLKRFPEVRASSRPVVRWMEGGRLHVIIHASLRPGLSMESASQITTMLEAAIKSGHPAIARVDIVQEPANGDPSRSTDSH